MLQLQIAPEEKTKEFVLRLKEVSQGLLSNEELVGTVQTIMEQALEVAKMTTPGTTLKNLWKLSRNQRKDFIEWIVHNEAERSPEGRNLLLYLEMGTRPHVIVPRSKRALHFLIDNVPIFARKVFHPGTRPYLMVASSQRYILERLETLVQALEKSIRTKISGEPS